MTFKFQHSITFKVLGIGLLALLMLIPLAQVQDLVRERSGMRAQALGSIEQRWGAAQIVGGPVLAIPKRIRVQAGTGWITEQSTEILLADKLDLRGTLDTKLRSYGIYATPVYEAELKISGRFRGADLHALGQSAQQVLAKDEPGTFYQFDQAELRLPLADVRGIRRISALHFDDREYTFAPSSPAGEFSHAVAVPVDVSRWTDDNHVFEVDLTLAGSTSLQFLPLARQTEANLAAAWANPGFIGAFLPAKHAVSAQGFDANWQVLDLNRSYGQHWQQDTNRTVDPTVAAFGVNLYQPADLYQRNERAGKYGVLFIALTFVAFFLFEILQKLRVHPVQYLLVGLALTTFYVVLLALSEQIGFAFAYLTAAACVVFLVGGYAAAVLRARRAGGVLAATLALVYALLYGLVISEQYSLLMGAIALLAVVAGLMYLTRKVDWYTYTQAALE